MSENPITIRSLGPEDAFVLDRARTGTVAGLNPTALWGFLATRVNELAVAIELGEVVGIAYGTVLMRPDGPSEFLLGDVRVHPDLRRRGIGRRLLEHLARRAEDRGCAAIRGLAGAGDGAGLALLRAAGAREAGRAVLCRRDME